MRELCDSSGRVQSVFNGPMHMQLQVTDVSESEHNLLHHAARTGGDISAHLLMLHSIPIETRIRLLQESLMEVMNPPTSTPCPLTQKTTPASASTP